MTGPSLQPGAGPVVLEIRSDGRSVDALSVVSVVVRRAVNAIPWARITLLDGDMPTGTWPLGDGEHFVPGSRIEILAGYGSESDAIFEGIVAKVGVAIGAGPQAPGELVVELRGDAVSLTRGRHSRVFADMTDSAIAASLIAGAGLTASVEQTSPQHARLVQHRCSDWDFLMARAEVNGLVVVADGSAVRVGAPAFDGEPVLALTYGVDIVSFDAELDTGTQPTGVQYSAWDPGTQAQVTGTQARPVVPPGRQDLEGESDPVLQGHAGGGSVVTSMNTAHDAGVLASWAEAHQTKAALARLRGRMSFQGSARAVPDAVVSAAGVGKRFGGRLYVSAVEHRIEEGDWVTCAEFGLDPDWFVTRADVAAPAAAGWAPASRGLQIGKVTKLDGDPESSGRIQVKLPASTAADGGDSLLWVRLLQGHASSGFGHWFVPEVDDEVVLGGVDDDPGEMVVLGSLYSKTRKSAYEATAANDLKAIVTRCLTRVEFDDAKKQVKVTTPAGNLLILSDEDKGIKLQDQTGNVVKLSTDGILLDSPGDIVIRATGKISLDATASMTLKAQADLSAQGLNVSCKAQVGFSAEGTATAQLSASGQTAVKGALVMIN